MSAKNEWVSCVKSIVLASLAVVGVFMLGAWVIAAVLGEIENDTVRTIFGDAMIMVLYAVFFYRFRMYKRLVTYAEHTDKFAFKTELTAYIRAEGKNMLVIYGILAVVTEFSCLLLQNAPRNPVAFATAFCLEPWMQLNVPVLRCVLAFVYSAAIVCLLAVLRSFKIHQQKIWIQKEKTTAESD